MICQQQTVAEDAPATRTILPAAGLLSFYFFAAAAVVTALAAAWAVIAAASFGFSLSSAAVDPYGRKKMGRITASFFIFDSLN